LLFRYEERETPILTSLTTSLDYFRSRDLFRSQVRELGWQSQAYPISAFGPDDEQLTIDVAWKHESSRLPTLFVSSGCHGVEGYFGSEVQRAWLDTIGRQAYLKSLNVVVLHALNPFGFAWHRRWNEDGIDLNRNFLTAGEAYQGVHPDYQRLNAFLNPTQPPGWSDLYYPRAIRELARIGFQAAAEAVAQGQYEFPGGLFFGGKQLSESGCIVSQHYDEWIPEASPVLHFDLHTGLGKWGACQLMIDRPMKPDDREWLSQALESPELKMAADDDFAYVARGGFGNWCAEQHPQADYHFICIEIGTYHALRVLRGLRWENALARQGLTSNSRQRAGERLRDLFFPRHTRWRSNSVRDSLRNIERGALAMVSRYSGES
jgi:hypothetical protein